MALLRVNIEQMIISVKVKTSAKSNQVIVVDKKTFEVRTTEKPENGKANKCVIDLLSKHFKIAKSKVSILKGINSRYKVIQIQIE